MKSSWKSWIEDRATRVLTRKASPLPVKELAWRGVWFAIKCGASHPLSFAVRPVVTHKRWRSAIGMSLVGLVICVGVLGTSPVFGRDRGGNFTLALNSLGGGTATQTQETVQIPLENVDVSQGYWLLHAGVDLRAPIGTSIKPIMAGVVKKIEYSRGGYGNLVVISHQANYESWYAHLSKINAVEGELVDLNTKIGEVGSTGRSTGPHLHLEIKESEKTVNPVVFLRLGK